MCKSVISTIWLLAVATVTTAAPLAFDDPLASEQWHLQQMNFPQAWSAIWAQPQRGQVKIAVLDSGFATTHPDLSINSAAGFNIVDGSSDIDPVHPHGSATAGIIGAQSGNGTGISQTAWTAEVLPIRVTNRPDGAAKVSDIAMAIRYAADHGAKVINASYSGVELKALHKAAKYAYRQGALTFMAAGNEGQHQRKWRNHKRLIAVGSVDQLDHRSGFSNWGRFVDFVAPGDAVLSLDTHDDYALWSGTSFSSPVAASVAALVFVANPDLSPDQVLKIMRDTAVDLGSKGRDNQYGFGRPDAAAAVSLALQTKGKWAKRHAKLGVDRYTPNDWSELTGVISGAASADVSINRLFASDFSVDLVLPQGFLADGLTTVPEPWTVGVLGVGMLIVLLKRPVSRGGLIG